MSRIVSDCNPSVSFRRGWTCRGRWRRAARAILINDLGQLVLIKRTKPDQAPYWTAPGGGVETERPGRSLCG
nr:NUDIX domain-containing protein [Pseudofrankia sp. DC12]